MEVKPATFPSLAPLTLTLLASCLNHACSPPQAELEVEVKAATEAQRDRHRRWAKLEADVLALHAYALRKARPNCANLMLAADAAAATPAPQQDGGGAAGPSGQPFLPLLLSSLFRRRHLQPRVREVLVWSRRAYACDCRWWRGRRGGGGGGGWRGVGRGQRAGGPAGGGAAVGAAAAAQHAAAGAGPGARGGRRHGGAEEVQVRGGVVRGGAWGGKVRHGGWGSSARPMLGRRSADGATRQCVVVCGGGWGGLRVSVAHAMPGGQSPT